MKVAADTDILVRALTEDDADQSLLAQTELTNADLVAVTLPALCELTWVLSRGYKIPSTGIADAMRRLIGGASVVTNGLAVEAGLAMIDAGGDFADGVIADEGRGLGAEVFLTLDSKAVKLMQAQGELACLLS